VRTQRFRQRVEDCHARAERGIRILKNHLKIRPGAAEFTSMQPVQVSARSMTADWK
jgi:hypothetical protein